MAVAIAQPGLAADIWTRSSRGQDSLVVDSVSEFRHLPPEPDRRKRAPGWTQAYLHRQGPFPDYKLAAGLDTFPNRAPPAARVDRRRAVHHLRQRWALDVAEGAALARSSVRLPGDAASAAHPRSSTLSRHPSLRRQEAFRADVTAKSARRQVSLEDSVTEDEAEQDMDDETAELYRLGLLYDDEHERGSLFDLGKITRPAGEAPAYTVREAKRVKRSSNRASTSGSGEEGFSWDFRAFLADHTGLARAHTKAPELSPLSLSLHGLAGDEAIARFLISPDDDFDGADDATDTSKTNPTPRSLGVIYEVEELVVATDEYDDEDEDDNDNGVESAETTQLPTAPPTPKAEAENEFPLGFDHSVSVYKNAYEDEDADWDDVTAACEAETDGESDDETVADTLAHATAASAADAWIVLGDDS